MASKNKLPPRLLREKLAFEYSTALEAGDFEALSSILNEAVQDRVLAQMLREIDEVYAQELDQTFQLRQLPGQQLIGSPRRQFRPVYWIALAASVALIFVAVLKLRPDDITENSSELLTPVLSPSAAVTSMPTLTPTVTPTAEPITETPDSVLTPTLDIQIPPVTIPAIVIPGLDLQIPTVNVPGVVIPTVEIHIPEVVVTIDVNPWDAQP